MLRQTTAQVGKVKTVTILLGAYFSALVAMVIFTAIFVYSNLALTNDTVAASDKVVHETKSIKVEEPAPKAGERLQSASLKELK